MTLPANRTQHRPAMRWGVITPLSLFLLSLALACGSSQATPVALEGDALEAVARSIDQNLMCPVCPGETIDQSQVELAKQMRQSVREKLAEGWTRDQILAYFSRPKAVGGYGPEVLAAPPKSGFNMLVWILPPGALAGGAVILYLVLKAMRRGTPVPASDDNTAVLQPYLEMVDRDLEVRTRDERGVRPGHVPLPDDFPRDQE